MVVAGLLQRLGLDLHLALLDQRLFILLRPSVEGAAGKRQLGFLRYMSFFLREETGLFQLVEHSADFSGVESPDKPGLNFIEFLIVNSGFKDLLEG